MKKDLWVVILDPLNEIVEERKQVLRTHAVLFLKGGNKDRR